MSEFEHLTRFGYLVCGPVWPKLEYIQDSINFLAICNSKKDQINNNREKVEILIFRHSRAANSVCTQLLNLAEIRTHPSFYACHCYQ